VTACRAPSLDTYTFSLSTFQPAVNLTEVFIAVIDEAQLVSDKKMLLKLDLILIPMTAMIFLLGFLDRGNIGNARVVSK
jgi:hypothetical protein